MSSQLLSLSKSTPTLVWLDEVFTTAVGVFTDGSYFLYLHTLEV